ncbi:unnamed protein product [Paramecium primaurelia]|uniref:Uncharacterized protein n=1 Tax=Paramecium primaurelia TaxID=5886 RepID=A0A8S1LU64_PARPR|nr:unnamed protein product [Paramecium primaurelia]
MEEQKEPDLLVIQENLQKIRKQLESVYRNIAKSFQDRIAIINT